MTVSKKLKVTGGARFGTKTATWPFASLWADSLHLSIAMPGGVIVLSPVEVLSLDTLYIVPIVAFGLVISHSRPSPSPKPLIFWCLFPARLRRRILKAGFVPKGR